MNVQDFPHTTDDSAGQALIAAAGTRTGKAQARYSRHVPCRVARLCGARRFAALRAGRACRHRRAVVVAARRTQSRHAQGQLRAGARDAHRVGARHHQRRHAVSARFGRRRAQSTRPRHPPVGPSGVRRRARRGGNAGRPSRAPRKGGGRRESFIHIHIEGVAEAARRAEIVRALEDILAEVRVAVQDWRPMLDWLRAIIAELRANPPPLRRRRNCRSRAVPGMAGGGQFHSARRARLRLHRRYRRCSNRCSIPGLACCARATCGRCSAGTSRSSSRRKFARSWRSRGSLSSPSRPCARRCIAASTWTISASSVSTGRASWSVNAASAACSPRPPIRVRFAPFPICGARPTTSSAAPASIRRAIPARRWSTCWRPIRATNCSRSTRTLLYQFALAILQLDERPRVRVLPRRDRFDRFVSVLVYIPRERYDGRIRALIGDYLAAAFNGFVRAFYPFFAGRPAGARALHHRPRRGRSAESRSRHARPRGRGHRAQLDRRLERGARRRL